MFWKKKKSSDLFRDPTGDNHRNAFRYPFGTKDGPQGAFMGKIIRLINISAGGLAFANQDFDQYDVGLFSMDLEVPEHDFHVAFEALVRILLITDDQVCHAIFEHCHIQDYEILHKYVLELQKRDLHQ